MQRNNIPSQIKYCMKIFMVTVTTTLMLQITFLLAWTMFTGATEINIRGRELHNSIGIEPIPCNPGTNGTSCICPNIQCLEYSEKIHGCHPIDCWKWNEIKTQCEEAGKEFLPAIILQAIPVTGAWGSGFGNMGRWDIFGTYWIVLGCGCLCSCCLSLVAKGVSKAEDNTEAVMVGCRCGSCLLSVAMTIMWIWGIVVIANKEVDAPWSDWEGNGIYCPLI
jgi:hypothetical protein